MLYLLKQLSFSKNFFHIWFYPVNLFENYLFVKPLSWNLNFSVNLVTTFSLQKPLKFKKQKSYDSFEYKVLPFCKLWAQTDKKLFL